MSKIKLEGNASGSGTLTISAPNTNTDRSLTLPDTAGEFVTADASGNVGIGTSSPSGKIQANAADSQVAVMAGGDVSDPLYPAFGFDGQIGSNGGRGAGMYLPADGTLAWSTVGSERMRIDSSGNLLVGKTSVGTGTAGLQLRGDGANGLLQASRTSGEAAAFHRLTDSGQLVRFFRDVTEVGSISVTTSATSYNTSSDYRLKENVVDMDGAIDRVKALQPRRFNFITDADTTVDGFIAHEVSDVVPEAISGVKDGTKEEEYEVTPAVLDDDGNVVTEAVIGTRTVPDYQGIDQSKLVPLLTGALQEAIAKIETLETRIEALENA